LLLGRVELDRKDLNGEKYPAFWLFRGWSCIAAGFPAKRGEMKAILVGTLLGTMALIIRDRMALYRAVRSSPERLGLLSNEYIARLLVDRLCTPGRTFIDVGAHIGSVIAGVRRASQPDRIIAVEANPDKARALQWKFPEVEVHACAVGEIEGEASFFINEATSGYSSVDRDKVNRVEPSDPVKEIKVPTRRLDAIVAPGGIDLIKVDVVGAELGVLKGSTEIIQHSRPIIAFESIPNPESETAALWQWFDDNGYAVIVPNRLAHPDDGLSRDSFVEGHLYPYRTMNYFGVPRERREATRVRAGTVLGNS
jgi:FkbM family methyltransferase